MNWAQAAGYLTMMVLWMVASMAIAVFLGWTIRRLFPSKPQDDYTYILKLKNGRKATVVMPPDLAEAEQQERMRQVYEQLGLPPMPHYPVPMPRAGANLWRLRRHTTKAFRSGPSQAIPIPPEIAYRQPDIELDIQRVGDELRIRPAQLTDEAKRRVAS